VTVKGPGNFPGYVDAALDAGVYFDDGWLNTGDLGRIDGDSYLWITGRAKDLIIRGGHNIDPSVIEEALVAHQAVRLAAAVGKPDAYAGELPTAYVELTGGGAVTNDALKAFVRKRITERAANPAEILFLETMPLTDIGKPDKVTLRHMAAKRVFTEVLAPLARDGVTIEIEVLADGMAGAIAAISLTAGGDAGRVSLERDVRGILGAYTIGHTITWK